MTMKIWIGDNWLGSLVTEQAVDHPSVRFKAEDGSTMFEVVVQNDGKSIEIRGVESCFVGGTLYNNRLLIKPNVSNSIQVTVEPYDA